MMTREGGGETYPAMRSSCSRFTGGVGNKDGLTLLSPTMAFAPSSLIRDRDILLQPELKHSYYSRW
jgi:hypothetical protein